MALRRLRLRLLLRLLLACRRVNLFRNHTFPELFGHGPAAVHLAFYIFSFSYRRDLRRGAARRRATDLFLIVKNSLGVPFVLFFLPDIYGGMAEMRSGGPGAFAVRPTPFRAWTRLRVHCISTVFFSLLLC